MRSLLIVTVLIAALGSAGGCVAVKPWERGDLSLDPMQAGSVPAAAMETNVETYREGAAGGAGGNAGGGCGCS